MTLLDLPHGKTQINESQKFNATDRAAHHQATELAGDVDETKGTLAKNPAAKNGKKKSKRPKTKKLGGGGGGSWPHEAGSGPSAEWLPKPPEKTQRHCQCLRLEGGVRQEVDLFFGDRHLLCSFLWGSRDRQVQTYYLPAPRPSSSALFQRVWFGVGLKGAGWTRTENDISTRTT